MTFRHTIFTFSVAALVTLPAGAATASPVSPAAVRSAVAAARPISPEADFLIAVHQGNLAQITAGRLAVRNSDNPVIRKLGKRISAYHKKLDSQVKKVSRTLSVRLPQEPNSEQQQLTARYRAATGTAFDTLFVTTQLANYERAARLAALVRNAGADPAVLKIVAKASPVIEQNRVALTAARQKLGTELPRQ